MNECILVVDDDREIVGAIAIVLEREGYTVRRAYDGLGAVEQALDPAVRLPSRSLEAPFDKLSLKILK